MDRETKTETNLKEAVPFFSVSNIEQSVRYCVDGLGFEMTRSSGRKGTSEPVDLSAAQSR